MTTGATPRPGGAHHLAALALALAVMAAGSAALWIVAPRLERRGIQAGIPLPRLDTNRGLALKRAALGSDSALVLYGTSELVRFSPFRATEFFARAPTGFRVVPVGDRGTPIALTAMDLAALGQSLRGRRVAISLSHTQFHVPNDTAYLHAVWAGNFSLQHAGAVAFAGGISPGLRRRLARRLLEEPAPLARDPLVYAALRFRAERGRWARLAIAALAPAGRAQQWLLATEDHARVIPDMMAGLRHPPPPAAPAALDWRVLRDSAERLARADSRNNPFGIKQEWWTQYGAMLVRQRASETDAEWRAGVAAAETWRDLELLLDVLAQGGAHPLLLSMPFKGPYFDYSGTTPRGRRLYYEMLRARAARAGVPVRDFAEFEPDTFFLRDQTAHLSALGWLYYDRALDEFVQGDGP